MSTNSTETYQQDDLGGVLASPSGAEHLAPLRPEPLAVVVVAAEAPRPASGAGVPPAAPEPAGRVLQVVVGATVLGCAAAGLFAWLR
ncbi:hypothetical protein [Massilia rubra]|uniref:Uncharacterized protein n=1 Tax=Massilia rubra TaxID=2607910 RepID=A0ABX0LIP8_9BURK|nr:hypothetical protein [Massilia rubra]NHZ34544.1 hypothetical protein [Massilia rubra]